MEVFSGIKEESSFGTNSAILTLEYAVIRILVQDGSQSAWIWFLFRGVLHENVIS